MSAWTTTSPLYARGEESRTGSFTLTDKLPRKVSRSAPSAQRKAAEPRAIRETPAIDQTAALIDDLKQMQRTPGSGVAMCHAQGKTAVYLSRDRRYIVEHPPHGPITRTPVNLDR